jgi:hypothetical protein
MGHVIRRLHHLKHHATYTEKLNGALSSLRNGPPGWLLRLRPLPYLSHIFNPDVQPIVE